MKKMFFLMLLMGAQAFAMDNKKEPNLSNGSANNGTKKTRKKVSPKFNFITQVPKATTYAHILASARSLSPNSKADLVNKLSNDFVNNKQALQPGILVVLLDAGKNITLSTIDQCKQHLRAEILEEKQHGNKLKKPTPPRERNERRNGTLAVSFPVPIPPTPTDATTHGNLEIDTHRFSVQDTSTSAPTTPSSTTNEEQAPPEEKPIQGYELLAIAVSNLENRAQAPRMHKVSRPSIYNSSPSATPRNNSNHRPSISTNSIASPQNGSYHHRRSYSAAAAVETTPNASIPTLNISANGIDKVSNGV